MAIIMGTSNCHMVLGTEEHIVPGMCGYVEDGIIPGFFGYEAGQSCVGDHFAWFTENCVPAAYEREAQARGISVHQLLEEKAGQLKPGESGLVALDWWNGNRSVLVDVDLTGLLIGATLLTKPEEIYRALIEATAYGTRIIIETFQANGVPIHQIVATGGLPDRNKLLMQIYADVPPADRRRGHAPGRRGWVQPCTARWQQGPPRAATIPSSRRRSTWLRCGQKPTRPTRTPKRSTISFLPSM